MHQNVRNVLKYGKYVVFNIWLYGHIEWTDYLVIAKSLSKFNHIEDSRNKCSSKYLFRENVALVNVFFQQLNFQGITESPAYDVSSTILLSKQGNYGQGIHWKIYSALFHP